MRSEGKERDKGDILLFTSASQLDSVIKPSSTDSALLASLGISRAKSQISNSKSFQESDASGFNLKSPNLERGWGFLFCLTNS